MFAAAPPIRDLVLVGGGHSHLSVLKMFGMRPVDGVRLTLVTRDLHTPYSGMLPGYVSGFYSYDECHIDLARLATFSRARLVHGEVCGIDRARQKVIIKGRPPLRYDVLSVNVGITPAPSVPGAREHTTPVKPIDGFVERFQRILERSADSDKALRVVVIGGGAGGVEVCLAVQARLAREARERGAQSPAVTLVSKGRILSGYTAYVRNAALAILASRGVQVVEDSAVVEVQAGSLHLGGGRAVAFDECLWCTQAAGAGWLAETGLPTVADGFLAVNEFLQSTGDRNVFAVGDCATSVTDPRPKAGVFAVRQGPVLANNLRAHLQGQPLQPFRPQGTYLSLISTGGRHCIAAKGWLAAQGAWLWTLKDWIDRSFVRSFGDGLPRMPGAATAQQPRDAVPATSAEELALRQEARMRCAGCGSKVGASALSRALSRARAEAGDAGARVFGDGRVEDAATLPLPVASTGGVLQSVDFFRSPVSDPYVLGRIAAVHSLSDLHAVGARPVAAMALCTVETASEALMEDDLYQMLRGAGDVFTAEGCVVSGGHTTEGPEAVMGFAVTGVEDGPRMRKGPMRPRDALVLTKALGTGALLAAGMRGAAKGRWVAAALAQMQVSNAGAARVAREASVMACTDVTGFGLLGHLKEMLNASPGVGVELDAASLPFLDGAVECVADSGVLSTLHVANARATSLVHHFEEVSARWGAWPLLVDPQTCGGLLFAVPGEAAASVVEKLRESGLSRAAVIGRVSEGSGVTVRLPKE